MNQLRTPDGLDKYLNETIRNLPVKIPDAMFQIFLWQKIKFDILLSQDKIEITLENREKYIWILNHVGVSEKIMIGYIHITENFHNNSDDLSTILSYKIKSLVRELTNLKIQNNWIIVQTFIVTTFKLSNYETIKLSQFPNNVKYLYLTESADLKEKHYELSFDDKINKFMEGDILLKGIQEHKKKLPQNLDNWTCNICDGNSETGCLYFDPSECPKFA